MIILHQKCALIIPTTSRSQATGVPRSYTGKTSLTGLMILPMLTAMLFIFIATMASPGLISLSGTWQMQLVYRPLLQQISKDRQNSYEPIIILNWFVFLVV